METYSEHKQSDKIYNYVTSSPIVSSRKDTTKAKNQRKWLLPQIRNQVLKDGKSLVSKSEDQAFSQHGSLYHRLTTSAIKSDIDVYVVLNGHGLVWGSKCLHGDPTSLPEKNPFYLPLSASNAARWMFKIVKLALSHNEASEQKVEQGKRGAVIKGLGKRDYDIIPAFVYKDDGDRLFHIIPGANGWESNPTTMDMRLVIELDKKYCRDPAQKILGYRDLVKFMKFLSLSNGWKESHGLSSFILRFVVAAVITARRSRFNQKNIATVIDELNILIDQGYFVDPYTQERIELQSSIPLENKFG